ncbi:MAG: Lsr2 family protein [Actinomycetota bacterium]|nr:Lsr2 family protein [Actinomycetota bacterium]
MARQQQISYTLTCDICAEEITDRDSDGASRRVSWQGAEYQLDLCGTHQGELDKYLHQLKEFVDAGQLVTGRRRTAKAATRAPRSRRATGATKPSAGRRTDVPAIRAWARENGYQVGDRARIAANIMAAYDEAHSSDGEAASASKSRRRAAKASAS